MHIPLQFHISIVIAMHIPLQFHMSLPLIFGNNPELNTLFYFQSSSLPTLDT